MKVFTLHLQAATEYAKVLNVTSFVGQDSTGKFGLMANHERFMTILEFGLARYKINNDKWCYVALPGGVLHFVENELFISSREYLIDENYEKLSDELEQFIRKEEIKTQIVRQSLHKLEQEMFKRLWNVGRMEN